MPSHLPRRKPARVGGLSSGNQNQTKGKSARMKLKQFLLSSVTALTVMVRGGNALAVTVTTGLHDAKTVHTDSSDSKDQPKPPKDHGDHQDASDAGDHHDQ